MGTTNYGVQTKSVGFFDLAKSGVINKRNIDVQERGIYKGGYLTVLSTVSASLSPLVCIINGTNADPAEGGPYQIRVETADAVTLSGFTPTNKYVVLRWAYTGDASTDYMDVLLQTSAQIDSVYDIIVGVGVFSGADLIDITYSDTTYPRTEPNVFQIAGKIDAQETPSMYVRVRGFNATYGTSTLKIYNHKCTSSPSFPISSAGMTNSRIDVLYLDTDGVVKKFTGSENVSPVAPSYQSKIALAEITVTPGMASITQSSIRDVRSFLTGGSATINGSQLAVLSGITVGAGVIPAANLPSGSWLTIPATSGNAYKYLRVNAAGTALEYMPPTYA
jgi:hypothetical protein